MNSKLKYALIINLATLIVLSVGGVWAADNWYAILFNATQHELVQVSLLDGSSATYRLGLTPTIRVSGEAMGVSNDGRLVAFCAETLDPGVISAQTTLIVRDIAAEANLAEVDLGDSIGCRVGRGAFASDNMRVAAAVARNAQDVPAADGRIWRIVVVDLASGQISQELNPTMTAAVDAGLPVDYPILPEFRAFDGNALSFAAMPYGVGGVVYGDVYTWDIATGSLEFLDDGPRSNASLSDSLTDMSETVWLDEDSNLAMVDAAPGPIGRFNVVRLAGQDEDANLIYHTADGVLSSPTFVAGGDSGLALQLYTSATDASSTWILLDREGVVSPLNHDNPVIDLVDAPGGYVTLQQIDDAGIHAQLAHHVIGGADASILWESPSDNWQIIWSSSVPPSMDMPAFPTIN